MSKRDPGEEPYDMDNDEVSRRAAEVREALRKYNSRARRKHEKGRYEDVDGYRALKDMKKHERD